MKVIIDTHALIWAIGHPRFFSSWAEHALRYSEQVLVSAASAYEIELKRPRDPRLGQLPGDLTPALEELRFSWLSITAEHASLAGKLPLVHRDPWDRIIAAQAISLDIEVVTTDAKLAELGARTIW